MIPSINRIVPSKPLGKLARSIHQYLLMSVVAILCCGCSRTEPAERTTESVRGSTMGTKFTVKYLAAKNAPKLTEIGKQIDLVLAEVNLQMSHYQDDAEVYRFNISRSTDWFSVSPQTAEVVQRSLEFYALSEGAFDITVAPLVDLWGFGPSRRPTAVPSQTQIERLLPAVGSDKLQVRIDPPALKKSHPETQIDLSAIAPGYAVDRVAETLEKFEITDYFIEIGGEVRTKGQRGDGRPWQVGIEHPDPVHRSIHDSFGLSGRSLATSGSYRNVVQFGDRRVSHFIDPKTGNPIESNLVSASVIMNDCASADAIATVLLLSGREKSLELAKQHQWPAMLIVRQDDKFETIITPQFEQQIDRSIKR